MRARTLIYVFFVIDAVVGLVVWALFGGLRTPEGEMLAADFARNNPGLTTLFFLSLGGLVIVEAIAVLTVHSRESMTLDLESEKVFEAEARQEIGFKVEPPPPEPAEPLAAMEVKGETPLACLLTQLRLAGLDPRVEGDVQQGDQKGAAILRLAGNESALALTHIPAHSEWENLFPRWDRVFIPLSETKWLSAERTETLVKRQDTPS